MHKPKVAFVCLHAYPLFDPRARGRIGGMETRSALFARHIAARGNWEVEFIVGDYGQSRVEQRSGVRLRIYRPVLHPIESNVLHRFVKRRWLPTVHLDRSDLQFLWQLPVYLALKLLPRHLLNRFWHRIAPNVVCSFGVNSYSAEIIADCCRSGIKTVLCIASDADLSEDLTASDKRPNNKGTPRWKGWYAVKNADRVFVQTEHQLKLLERNFGRTGDVVRNPVSASTDSRASWPIRGEREFVLWIGRSDTFHKRPLLMLELARACPEIPIVMIVNRNNPAIYREIERLRPGNVTLIEQVPHHEIWDYYRRAKIFVSTSAYEGFPNSFLQAAVCGTPVVSLDVDPEGILAEQGCGILANGEVERLAGAIRELWSNETLAEEYASRFFDYVLRNHGLDQQSAHFEAFLEEAIRDTGGEYDRSGWLHPFRRFVTRTNSGSPSSPWSNAGHTGIDERQEKPQSGDSSARIQKNAKFRRQTTSHS